MSDSDVLCCSFCSKPPNEVNFLISSDLNIEVEKDIPGFGRITIRKRIAICDQCTLGAVKIILEQNRSSFASQLEGLQKEMKEKEEPVCRECGNLMQRFENMFRCLNCGAT